MKVKFKTTVDVDIVFLKVQAGVRYWEDSTVNGEEDSDGNLMPFRVNNCWCPIIEVDTGKIQNWPKGVRANVHYKVCDSGVYSLVDSEGNTMIEVHDYVPSCMSPKSSGYGDYIIMDINEDGVIQNWKFSMDGLQDEE